MKGFVMLAIMICPKNLPLITVLNDGVTPAMEEETTWFIFNPNGPNDIVKDDVTALKFIVDSTLVNAHIHVISPK